MKRKLPDYMEPYIIQHERSINRVVWENESEVEIEFNLQYLGAVVKDRELEIARFKKKDEAAIWAMMLAGDVNLDNCYIKDIDFNKLFRKLTPEQKIRSFSAEGAIFDGDVSFTGVDFGDAPAMFPGAFFNGFDVSFEASRFGGGACFALANFIGGLVSFTHTKFCSGEVSFNVTSFGNGSVQFAKADFGECNVSFLYTNFGNGLTLFNESDFSQGAVSFENSKFGEGCVSFEKAKLRCAEQGFKNAEFSGEKTIFLESVFSGEAIVFKNVIFKGNELVFDKSRFTARGLDFIDSNFAVDKVSFDSAEFFCDTKFSNTIFSKGQISFKDTNFQNCEFLFDGVDFSNCNLSLNGALASNSAIRFLGCQINNSHDLRVSKVDKIDFHNCIIEGNLRIQDAYCKESLINQLSFEGSCNIGLIHIKWMDAKASMLSWHVGDKGEKHSSASLAEQFSMLKENYHRQGAYDTEDESFVEYMRYHAHSRWHLRFTRILDYIGGYGTKPIRLSFVMIGVILLFWGIFSCLEHYNMMNISSAKEFNLFNSCTVSDVARDSCIEDAPFNIFHGLYFSIITFLTIGDSEMSPANELSALCVGVEGFIGLFLMSYFIVSLVRKTLR